MATITEKRIDVAYTISGNTPQTIVTPEAANQTFKAGAILTLDAAGRVIEATSPNPVRILGVAEADANNLAASSTNLSRVLLANDDTVFRANVKATQVTAQSDLGQVYGLFQDATPDIWVIDKTAVGANGRCIIVGFWPGPDAIGDIQGRLLFLFSTKYAIMTTTS